MLNINNDIVYRQILDKLGTVQHQMTPKEIRYTIFTPLHEQRYAGHLGSNRTTAAIKKKFYWPGMSENVRRW